MSFLTYSFLESTNVYYIMAFRILMNTSNTNIHRDIFNKDITDKFCISLIVGI